MGTKLLLPGSTVESPNTKSADTDELIGGDLEKERGRWRRKMRAKWEIGGHGLR